MFSVPFSIFPPAFTRDDEKRPEPMLRRPSTNARRRCRRWQSRGAALSFIRASQAAGGERPFGMSVRRESGEPRLVRLRIWPLLSAFGPKTRDGKGPRIRRDGANNEGKSTGQLVGDCRLATSGTSSVASGDRIGERSNLLSAKGSASTASANTKRPS